MVLPKALNQVIRLGNLPCRQQMGLRLVRLFQAHVVHHRNQMQVDCGNGVTGRPHGKGGLHHASAGAVLLL